MSILDVESLTTRFTTRGELFEDIPWTVPVTRVWVDRRPSKWHCGRFCVFSPKLSRGPSRGGTWPSLKYKTGTGPKRTGRKITFCIHTGTYSFPSETEGLGTLRFQSLEGYSCEHSLSYYPLCKSATKSFGCENYLRFVLWRILVDDHSWVGSPSHPQPTLHNGTVI